MTRLGNLSGLSSAHWIETILLGLLLSWPCVSAGASLTGEVVSVLDGDIIEVLNSHHAERIRLSGIDCPEKGLAYGEPAKQAASALVFERDVTLQTHGQDKYGRTLSNVLLPDGTNVNHELIKDGRYCWCLKYAPNLNLQG